MNDRPRVALQNLIAEYGAGLSGDTRRLKGLLLDTCGEQSLEVDLLVTAAQEGVASDILALTDDSSAQLALPRLTRRLQEEESWFSALGRKLTIRVERDADGLEEIVADRASPPFAVPTSAQLLAGAGLIVLSLCVSLAGHIVYLTADPSDGFEDYLHGIVLLVVALALVLMGLGLLWWWRQVATENQIISTQADRATAFGLSFLTAAMATVGLILGLDERLDAMTSWMQFAFTWGFVSFAFLLIARPIPEEWGAQRGDLVGLGFYALTVLLLMPAMVQGLGGESSGIKGYSWAFAAMIMALLGTGWLFALPPSRQEA